MSRTSCGWGVTWRRILSRRADGLRPPNQRSHCTTNSLVWLRGHAPPWLPVLTSDWSRRARPPLRSPRRLSAAGTRTRPSHRLIRAEPGMVCPPGSGSPPRPPGLALLEELAGDLGGQGAAGDPLPDDEAAAGFLPGLPARAPVGAAVLLDDLAGLGPAAGAEAESSTRSGLSFSLSRAAIFSTVERVNSAMSPMKADRSPSRARCRGGASPSRRSGRARSAGAPRAW